MTCVRELVFAHVSVQLVANAYQLIKIIAYFSAFRFAWPSSGELFALGLRHTLLWSGYIYYLKNCLNFQ